MNESTKKRCPVELARTRKWEETPLCFLYRLGQFCAELRAQVAHFLGVTVDCGTGVTVLGYWLGHIDGGFLDAT